MPWQPNLRSGIRRTAEYATTQSSRAVTRRRVCISDSAIATVPRLELLWIDGGKSPVYRANKDSKWCSANEPTAAGARTTAPFGSIRPGGSKQLDEEKRQPKTGKARVEGL